MDSLTLPKNLDLPLPLAMDPTKIDTSPQTLQSNLLHPPLQKRYTTISIPSTYGRQNTSPQPGTVAGIVLGTVGSIVILLYLTFIALNPAGIARGSSSVFTDEEDVVIRSRRGGSSRRRSGSEMIEVVEERERERDRGRRESYRRRPSRRGDDHRITVEESVTGTTTTGTGDDEQQNVVEVIEEESSALSSVSTMPSRGAGGRSYRSGVRMVNPNKYGGESDYGSRY